MLPSLTAFSNVTGFDDSCYLQAKDASWAALLNSPVDRGLSQTCMRNAPDTEEFSHELTSYALNAALATSAIAEFTLDGRGVHIAYVPALARDSVYLYLSNSEPSVLSSAEQDNEIAKHPLMQQEQRRQEEDIGFLRGMPEQFDKDIISTLKARASVQVPLLPLAHCDSP
jgi:uncharacterized protein